MGGQRVDNEERYEARAWCGNCGYLGPVHPLLGKWVSAEKCPVCRVNALMPLSAPAAQRAILMLEQPG